MPERSSFRCFDNPNDPPKDNSGQPSHHSTSDQRVAYYTRHLKTVVSESPILNPSPAQGESGNHSYHSADRQSFTPEAKHLTRSQQALLEKRHNTIRTVLQTKAPNLVSQLAQKYALSDDKALEHATNLFAHQAADPNAPFWVDTKRQKLPARIFGGMDPNAYRRAELRQYYQAQYPNYEPTDEELNDALATQDREQAQPSQQPSVPSFDLAGLPAPSQGDQQDPLTYPAAFSSQHGYPLAQGFGAGSYEHPTGSGQGFESPQPDTTEYTEQVQRDHSTHEDRQNQIITLIVI